MGGYLSAFYWLLFPAIILFFFVYLGSYFRNKRLEVYTKFDDNDVKTKYISIPRSYPLLGHLVAIIRNRKHMVQWTAELVNNSPSFTCFLHLPLRRRSLILTSNPVNIQHILKTRFSNYQHPRNFRVAYHDLFRDNLFLAEGQDWRKQRQLVSHEFSSRSFRKFVKLVTENEVSNRLIPLLSMAAVNNTVIDLHDIFRRFTCDVVIKIGLGHDLAYLSNSPSSPLPTLADSFECAKRISWIRLYYFPVIWKAKRFFDMGSEKRLRLLISEMREFFREIIRRKKQESLDDHDDFISGLMNRRQIYDDEILIDTSINFILGGLDTVVATLTWYFLSILKKPNVVDNIVKEIREKNDTRDMVYTHASIFESLRLYPTFPVGGMEAQEDDVLPDGTEVKKGTVVMPHTYALGRSSELWGSNWPEFLPERWLKRPEDQEQEELLTFVARDSFTFPVFNAGPRICLGKEIALTQIKIVIAGVLRRFHIVSAMEEDHEPVFLSQSTNAFLVKVVSRS